MGCDKYSGSCLMYERQGSGVGYSSHSFKGDYDKGENIVGNGFHGDYGKGEEFLF